MMSDYQAERLSRERRAITEIVQTLSATAELPTTLTAVIEKILEVVEPAETGIIFFWNDSNAMLRPSAMIGYDIGVFEAVGLKMGESLPGKVFSLGRASIYTSSTEIARSMGNLRPVNLDLWQRALGREHQPNSILVAPITSGSQKHGILMLETFNGSTYFSEQDLAFIQLIADLVALRVECDIPDSKTAFSYSGEHVRTEWIETLSHELGMPLTAIKGYATALLLDEVKWSVTKRQEFLQLIEDECDQMETLLRDLLTSTFTDTDTFCFETQLLEISQIAQAVAEEMENRTEKHQLIVDFPPNLPLVKVDPRWIRQVFRNLLDNAIKYSPDGGLIVIRGEVRSSDAVIHISDQGIGIPPEDLFLIFDKYVRVKPYDGLQVPGTGLGLPIARAIIEAHGGRIWANSKVNEGTTLSFSIPLGECCKQASGDRNE